MKIFEKIKSSIRRNNDNNPHRTLYINQHHLKTPFRYPNNFVTTAKYSLFSFLPLFFYEQFRKFANIFFLFCAVIQQIEGVSPTSPLATALPLGLVLLATAYKEIYEDLKRHKQDKVVNKSVCNIYNSEEMAFIKKKWFELSVGDVVRLEGGEPLPADIILLSSSEPDGLCYIETSNLDGETNLKIKQAKQETSHLCLSSQLADFEGQIICEKPTNSLYTFEGTLNISTLPKPIPLDYDQLLLRGSVLRNTKWIFGVVIYTGRDTRLVKNTRRPPLKQTKVERTINIQMAMLFAILFILALISTILSFVNPEKYATTYAYLDTNHILSTKTFILNFLTFIILYNNLIPISLIVTMEIVKFQQASLIDEDLDMYYSSNDTPASARTSTLVEELGQVEYIFSDKTGTLTCNRMELKRIIIGAVLYIDDEKLTDKSSIRDSVPTLASVRLPGQESESSISLPIDRDESSSSGIIVDHEKSRVMFNFMKLRDQAKSASSDSLTRQFLTILSVCHTVIPERKDDSELDEEVIYQASSPDEAALVKGVVKLGFKYLIRRPKSVTVKIFDQYEEHEILNVLEFNSNRKRMSVISKSPDGKIVLMTKGADTVILERLDKHNNPHGEKILELLEDCATEGLRTLCIAYRIISEEEYASWNKIYEEASITVNQRSEALDKAAELIEKDLFFIGATAIEDKLQDGVPETIYTLSQAGIKIWILTGDRQETAINIGYSCKLLTEDMALIIVNERTKNDTKLILENRLNTLNALKNGKVTGLGGSLSKSLESSSSIISSIDQDSYALIIDGKALEFALEPDLEKLFFDLAHQCKSVICCRVSPLQKALVVRLVKKYTKSVVLSIGDGANDVGMIQAAHIGVGISGQEGLQAARSSDYSIAQFRYLRKLLLVHGSWSYQRLSKMVLYSFYKNICLYMTQFWYSWYNLYSGQTFYESWIISLYNVFFTFWPPVVIGVTDQHITARQLDNYPQLYRLGQKGEFFNLRKFWGWTINAIAHSCILFFMVHQICKYDWILGDGRVAGHWFVGVMLYTCVLATVLLKSALITNNWTKFAFVCIPGSFIIWFIFIPFYTSIFPSIYIGSELYGITKPLFSSPVFWLTVIILPLICLFRDFVWKYLKRQYFPKSYHIIQEFHKFNIPDFRPRMDRFRKAIHKVRQIQRMKRVRGYAFSQGETGQASLIRLYDTTKSKPRGI